MPLKQILTVFHSKHLFIFRYEILFLISVILLRASNTVRIHVSFHDEKPSILNEIFPFFENFTIFIHFNEASSNLLANIIPNRDVILNNNDQVFHKKEFNGNRRPYVHLLLVNDELFEHPEVNARNLRNSDIVYYLILNNIREERKICKTTFLQQARGVIIDDITSKIIYTCNYFVNHKYINSINNNDKKATLERIGRFRRTFNNFRGYKFKVGYIEMEPLIYTK